MAASSLYPRGTTLFREGDTIRTVYLVLSGVISLRSFQNGHEQLVALRTPGWLLGAAQAVRGDTHMANAVAMTRCELSALDVHQFHRLRRTDADLRDRLQRMLADEVAEQFRRAAAAAGANCLARLQHMVSDLFHSNGQRRADGSVRLMLDLSVTDLANLVGVGREHLSRMLPRLAAENMLVRERGWFIAPAGSPLLTHAGGSVKSRLSATRVGD
jgi:CRP/FNR family transcriptional regulator, cyclic AMP receptor protein